jgi:lipoprotein-anchoring transpeptidase ErfK/SrfK
MPHPLFRPSIALLLSALSPLGANATATNPRTANNDALALQVALDRAGFSPGAIDGTLGRLTREAVKGFQEAHGLAPTGRVDAETKAALGETGPATQTLEVTEAGPFQASIPEDLTDQAKLEKLGYTGVEEALAERYHTTPATLRKLNPGADFAVGQQITVPAVAVAVDGAGTSEWETTLDKLSVAKNQPAAAKVVVSKSNRNVRVFDSAGKVIAQFPATIGSQHDPLPLGTWKIRGVAKLPSFHYNPDLFWDASAKDDKAKLPAGPNSPVGVAWIDLSKEHYGIHGTSEPAMISRTSSHGCIRLTNWDVAKLAQMVHSGTPALLQE